MQSRRELSFPSTVHAGTRTRSGGLAFVCDGQQPGTLWVALFEPQTGFEDHHDPEPERPRAMVQIPGEAPVYILPNAHREQLLVYHATPDQPQAALLTAIDVKTASPLWRLGMDEVGPAPIVVGGRSLLFVDPREQLVGCDLEGHERWSSEPGGKITAGPIERRDLPGFLIATDTRRVCDFSADGELRHTWRLPEAAVGLAPGRPGVVYGHDGRRLWRLDDGADTPTWEAELEGSPDRRFAVDPRGVTYLVNGDGGVLRVAADGSQVEALAGFDWFGAPVLDHSGAVVFATVQADGGDLLVWPPSAAAPAPLPGALTRMLPEPVLLTWAEPHMLTLVSESGTVVTLRCTT